MWGAYTGTTFRISIIFTIIVYSFLFNSTDYQKSSGWAYKATPGQTYPHWLRPNVIRQEVDQADQ